MVCCALNFILESFSSENSGWCFYLHYSRLVIFGCVENSGICRCFHSRVEACQGFSDAFNIQVLRPYFHASLVETNSRPLFRAGRIQTTTSYPQRDTIANGLVPLPLPFRSIKNTPKQDNTETTAAMLRLPSIKRSSRSVQQMTGEVYWSYFPTTGTNSGMLTSQLQ